MNAAPEDAPRPASLRQLVLAAGQDVRRCQQCALCDVRVDGEMDLAIPTVLQLVLDNDDEVLTSRTLWSDQVLAAARNLCARSLKLEAVWLALRTEAGRRGLTSRPAQPLDRQLGEPL